MEPCFILFFVIWSLPTLHPGLELITKSQKPTVCAMHFAEMEL